MSLPRIPIDDPRVVVLARARQQLAHRGVLAPTWDELTDEERAGSLPDARNYLESAINAGLIAQAQENPTGAAEWHWTITVTWSTSTGIANQTIDGLVTPRSGATRKEIFRDVEQQARRYAGQPDEVVMSVVFFSLEPNQLAS